jgi:hypothetical protein
MMKRIADFFSTLLHGIAGALSAVGHGIITVITLPFRAVAKLFRR